MAAMTEHTATMTQHVHAVRGHHEQMGAGIGQLYEVLMLAQKLVEDLNAAYAELANGHQYLGAAVGQADEHMATMHEAAQQLAAGQPN